MQQSFITVEMAKVAILATRSVLTNIANCDFATKYGTSAAYALREYKADIAADIFTVLMDTEEKLPEWVTEYFANDNNWKPF